jgi:hypothetical protein
LACCAGSIVPEEATVCRRVLVAAATVRCAGAARGRVIQKPTPAPARTTTTPTRINHRLVTRLPCFTGISILTDQTRSLSDGSLTSEAEEPLGETCQEPVKEPVKTKKLLRVTD